MLERLAREREEAAAAAARQQARLASAQQRAALAVKAQLIAEVTHASVPSSGRASPGLGPGPGPARRADADAAARAGAPAVQQAAGPSCSGPLAVAAPVSAGSSAAAEGGTGAQQASWPPGEGLHAPAARAAALPVGPEGPSSTPYLGPAHGLPQRAGTPLAHSGPGLTGEHRSAADEQLEPAALAAWPGDGAAAAPRAAPWAGRLEDLRHELSGDMMLERDLLAGSDPFASTASLSLVRRRRALLCTVFLGPRQPRIAGLSVLAVARHGMCVLPVLWIRHALVLWHLLWAKVNPAAAACMSGDAFPW